MGWHKSHFYFLCSSMKLINYLWLENLKQQKTQVILEKPQSHCFVQSMVQAVQSVLPKHFILFYL